MTAANYAPKARGIQGQSPWQVQDGVLQREWGRQTRTRRRGKYAAGGFAGFQGASRALAG